MTIYQALQKSGIKFTKYDCARIGEAAKKADYEGAIKLQGMVDAWKKTARDLQKVLNLR